MIVDNHCLSLDVFGSTMVLLSHCINVGLSVSIRPSSLRSSRVKCCFAAGACGSVLCFSRVVDWDFLCGCLPAPNEAVSSS
jgi:hypothetical protein